MKRFLNFFRNEWPLKLISLLLGVVIWFLICEYVDPTTEVSVRNIPITVDYDDPSLEAQGLAIATVVDEMVDIQVSGSRDTLALMDRTRITASLNLSEVNASNSYNLPVDINAGGQSITVTEKSVETIEVQIDKRTEANIKVNVTVSGSVPDGYIREAPIMLSDYINVSGPESVVSTIVSAEIMLDEALENKTVTFPAHSYIFVDEEGNEVPKTLLRTNVDTIDVTIPVVKKKTVPLTVKLVNNTGGTPDAFCSYTIEPQTITISGGDEALDTINAIELSVIDVAELTENFETVFDVVAPSGVKNVDDVKTAKVTVNFTDSQTRTFQVERFELQNVPDGIGASVTEKNISITVRGLPADLQRLSAGDIKVVVDMKNESGNGNVSKTATVEFPDGFNVDAVGKYQLTVVVS